MPPQPRQAEFTGGDARRAALVVLMPVEELRATAEALETAYEAAWALADEGIADFAGFGEAVKTALAIVRGRLREVAP